MDQYKEKYGPWALITGASSGLGAEFARQLAKKGLNLIIAARRTDRLEDLAEQLRKDQGIDVRCVGVDLSVPDFLPTILKATEDVEVGLLVNNAGYGMATDFLASDLEKELHMFHTNCRAPLILAHEFGRQMRRRGRGGMIFLSSMVGMWACPWYSGYSAAKGFDMLLGESLHYELKKAGIDVLAVCPGETDTEFQPVAGVKGIMPASPVPVIRESLDSLGRRAVLVPGALNRFFAFSLIRLWPGKLRARVMALGVRLQLRKAGRLHAIRGGTGS